MKQIFLAGPWEKYQPIMYKSTLVTSVLTKCLQSSDIFVKDIDFYNPENHQDGDWFENNYWAIKQSNIMMAYVPEFPMPGVAAEVGMFYHMHQKNCNILNNLVIWWPNDVKKTGQSVFKRMGIITNTLEETTDKIMECLKNGNR